jgi:hypothetical protein
MKERRVKKLVYHPRLLLLLLYIIIYPYYYPYYYNYFALVLSSLFPFPHTIPLVVWLSCSEAA